jgi:hypothetical protein
MLRPLSYDILALIIPILIGAMMFWCGRSLRRFPRILEIGLIVLAVAIVIGGAASLAGYLPDRINWFIWQVGGGTILLSWVAIFLLGIAWASQNHRLSHRFLATLVALGGCLVLIEGSGRLWWRYATSDLWENTPDVFGLMRQSSGMTCSPTAAAMLLHLYGIQASEGEMAYLAGTSLFGSDAFGMAHALREKVRPYGWQVYAGHTTYEECFQRKQPFVAHVEGKSTGHAILVVKVSEETMVIIDPSEGSPRLMARSDFQEIWDKTIVRIDQPEKDGGPAIQ